MSTLRVCLSMPEQFWFFQLPSTIIVYHVASQKVFPFAFSNTGTTSTSNSSSEKVKVTTDISGKKVVFISSSTHLWK